MPSTNSNPLLAALILLHIEQHEGIGVADLCLLASEVEADPGGAFELLRRSQRIRGVAIPIRTPAE